MPEPAPTDAELREWRDTRYLKSTTKTANANRLGFLIDALLRERAEAEQLRALVADCPECGPIFNGKGL